MTKEQPSKVDKADPDDQGKCTLRGETIDLAEVAARDSRTPPTPLPGDFGHPSVSACGRFVAFDGKDDAGKSRVVNAFVHDLLTRKTFRVSGAKAGQLGGGFPAISADGTKVAYLDPPDPPAYPKTENIFIADWRTGTARKLAFPGLELVYVSFSPDQRWLLVHATTQLWLVELHGEKRTRIDDGKSVGHIDSSYAYSGHAWSLDSRFLSFGSVDRGFRKLFLFDVKEMKLTWLLPKKTSDRFDPSDPSLSEDGRLILFKTEMHNVGNGSYLWAYDRKEDTLREVGAKGSESPFNFDRGVLLPDGKTVVYGGNFETQRCFSSSLEKFEPELIAANLDGTPTVFRTCLLGMAERAHSSDGRLIVFSARSAGVGTRDIWIVDRLTKRLVKVNVG